MSWDSDQDRADDLGGPYGSVACTDCGAPFATDGTTAVCEACWDIRDAHTDALELRMAKADTQQSVARKGAA